MSSYPVRISQKALTVDMTQFFVYVILLIHGGEARSVTELMNWTGLATNSIYGAVKRLEESGLIVTYRTKECLGNCKTWRTEIRAKTE